MTRDTNAVASLLSSPASRSSRSASFGLDTESMSRPLTPVTRASAFAGKVTSDTSHSSTSSSVRVSFTSSYFDSRVRKPMDSPVTAPIFSSS